MPEVSIIDYGMGNLWSVKSAFEYLGKSTIITSDPNLVSSAKVLILPGVGSFRRAMESLKSKLLDEAIIQAVSSKNCKILGICLGMQLMGMSSTENGKTNGLGLFNSKSDKFNNELMPDMKVPHVGFNSVVNESNSKLFKNIPSGSDFYFTHSYKMSFKDLPGIKSISNNSIDFLSAYETENIFATQFHPEKSQTNGLQLLLNFLKA